HFSTEYNELKNLITILIDKLEKGVRPALTDQSHWLYESLKAKYNLAIESANKALIEANGKLKQWTHSLSAKKNDPFKPFDKVNSDLSDFSKFNEILVQLIEVIKEHNEVTRSHHQKAESAKKKIEYH